MLRMGEEKLGSKWDGDGQVNKRFDEPGFGGPGGFEILYAKIASVAIGKIDYHLGPCP